jgi:hypothetical protein
VTIGFLPKCVSFYRQWLLINMTVSFLFNKIICEMIHFSWYAKMNLENKIQTRIHKIYTCYMSWNKCFIFFLEQIHKYVSNVLSTPKIKCVENLSQVYSLERTCHWIKSKKTFLRFQLDGFADMICFLYPLWVLYSTWNHLKTLIMWMCI